MTHKARTDLGIAIGYAQCRPGQRRTAFELAALADCPESTIQRIEWRALTKLARSLSCSRLGAELRGALFRR